MILGFKKTFPWGEPTYFKEKILAGVGYGPIVSAPKIHTIRAGLRWRPGMSIQMAYGVRTKKYEQFNKGIEGLQKAVNVQSVNLWFTGSLRYETGFPVPELTAHMIVDGYRLRQNEVDNLWRNDGFDSLYDFCQWFGHGHKFYGQIIHFTDFRY